MIEHWYGDDGNNNARSVAVAPVEGREFCEVADVACSEYDGRGS